MRTSEAGKDLIKSFEELRLEAYLCPAGVPTIGYGSTKNVKMGDICTEEEADEMLEDDLIEAENAVNDFVEVDLSQNEFDALVSFTFNCGVGAFKGSTLIKLLNDGKISSSAAQFLRWNKSNGQVLAGLTRRRKAEMDMFLGK